MARLAHGALAMALVLGGIGVAESAGRALNLGMNDVLLTLLRCVLATPGVLYCEYLLYGKLSGFIVFVLFVTQFTLWLFFWIARAFELVESDRLEDPSNRFVLILLGATSFGFAILIAQHLFGERRKKVD